MHDDVPEVSRILAILSLSESGEYDKSATIFFLLASGGYDSSPYVCQKISEEMVQFLLQKQPWNSEWITYLRKKEDILLSLEKEKDILSHATDGCFALFER
jgi:hypothetical protein